MKNIMKKTFFHVTMVVMLLVVMVANVKAAQSDSYFEESSYFKVASGYALAWSEVYDEAGYGELVTGVAPGTTAGQVCDNALFSYGLKVGIVDETTDEYGEAVLKVLEETDRVYTGCLLVTYEEDYEEDIYDPYLWVNAYIIIVDGDADGDGDRDADDMKLGVEMMLEGRRADEYSAAFDKNLDGEITLAELRCQTVEAFDENSDAPDEVSPFADSFAFVLEDEATYVSMVENGKAVIKSYLTVYLDGKAKDVPVKKITEDMVSDPEWEGFLVNYDEEYEEFDFSEYVGKLAVAYNDDEGYYFKLLSESDYNDSSVLEGDDAESAYMYTSEEVWLSFDDVTKRITLSDTAEAGFVSLAVKDYSQIVLTGYDAEDEWICLSYTGDEIYKIAEETELYYAVVMVQNNPGVTKMENLVMLYGEAWDELPSEALDFRPVPASASFSQDENWGMVLDSQVTEYAIKEDDIIVNRDLLTIIEDGKTTYVPVKKITQFMVDYESKWKGYIPCYDEDYYEYDFSEYVGKPAVAQKDHKGRYIFRTLEIEDYNDGDVLLYDESDIGNSEGAIFAFTAENVALIKKVGYSYIITSDGESEYSDSFTYGENNETTFKQLTVKDYTKIIIKSVDAEGEPVISAYDYENLPDFAHDFYFDKVTVVVGNNSKTMRNENLSFFYGETDREIEIYPGKITGFAIVNSYEIDPTDSGNVYYVSAYDTKTGNIGTYEAFYGYEMLLEQGELLGITSKGYIMDDYSFGSILEQGEPDLDIYDFDDKVGNLGWCELAAYDAEAKIIELKDDSNCYYVDDKTVFVEYDISDAWSALRSDLILTSNAAKNNFDGKTGSFKAVYVTANELETSPNEGLFTAVSVILVHK